MPHSDCNGQTERPGVVVTSKNLSLRGLTDCRIGQTLDNGFVLSKCVYYWTCLCESSTECESLKIGKNRVSRTCKVDWIFLVNL